MGFSHVSGFSQMLSLDLIFKGLVSGLREVGLLFKNRPNTHGFLKHDDTSGQVHAKILHCYIKTFRLVQFLFNNEHVVVEKLLQFFVYKVNGNLFESIVVEHFEASNIQYSAKGCSCNTTNTISCLFAGLTLGYPFSTDLDFWFA